MKLRLLLEYIKKMKGGKYIVMSEKGKKLSKPLSKKKAKKRLSQIEFFKHKNK